MPVFQDQTGQSITLDRPPQRIVSLVPSQTELLYDLGLDHEVVGITKFCIHPEHWFLEKKRVGGTKQLHLDQIHALEPDIIIANKEENVKEQVEELARHYPVWTSDIHELHEALSMIETIGSITGRAEQGLQLASGIRSTFQDYAAELALHPVTPRKTAYLIWKEPYMSAGGDTFIHDMLTAAGFHNMFADRERYPEVTIDELRAAELLLLSSEPYPFSEKHIAALQPLLPNTQIMLVDGEMFSWYGSRLRESTGYFKSLGNAKGAK